MTGEALHDFDIRLCIYALNNIRGKPSSAEYAEYIEYVEKVLEPPTLAYLVALGADDGDVQPLLLPSEELYVLASDIEGGPVEFNKRWEADDRVHQMSFDCTRVIREAFSLTHADAWASASAEFAAELERGRFLSTGLYVILAWIDELRRHLRALGATALLPRPEGSFPTPACPEPAAILSPATMTAKQDQPGNHELLAAVSKVHDLLVSQRTVKDWYSTEEVAQILSKSEYTVREWCRLGHCNATKRKTYRGGKKQWMISHDELLKLQSDGPAPLGTFHA